MCGLLIVISGPSGVGKGTICKKLCHLKKGLNISVSATTRRPRPGEIEGESYFFLNKSIFQEMISSGSFLEWAKVFDNYYGTPKEPVYKIIAANEDVLLEIDVQGALQVRENYPGAVYIFIAPPSLKELRKRIIGRGTETPPIIEQRMEIAVEELKSYKEYDYLIINDNIEDAVKKTEAIINAERCRVGRYPDFYGNFV